MDKAKAKKTDQKRPKKDFAQRKASAPLSEISSCISAVKASWKRDGSLAGLWQDWPKLCGEQLAKNCQPLSLKQETLIIGASHPQWLQALQYTRIQLLAAIQAKGYRVRNLKIQLHFATSTKKQESEISIWDKHPSRADVHGIDNCGKCGSPSPAGELILWGVCSFCKRNML